MEHFCLYAKPEPSNPMEALGGMQESPSSGSKGSCWWHRGWAGAQCRCLPAVKEETEAQRWEMPGQKAGRAEDSRKESPAGHSRVCSKGAREGEHRAGA